MREVSEFVGRKRPDERRILRMIEVVAETGNEFGGRVASGGERAFVVELLARLSKDLQLPDYGFAYVHNELSAA